jgi:hypothetical protein
MIAASSGMCSWTVVAACFAVALPLARRWAAKHGLALAAPMVRAMSLEGDADFWPWHCHPRGNHRRGRSDRSVLHLWCGCDRSGRSHRAMPLRGREVEAPVSTQRHEELLGGVLYHGSLRG